MMKNDGRKINPKAMEAIRVRAVQRVHDGQSPEAVIKTLHFSRLVSTTGWQDTDPGAQMKRLYNIIRDKNPRQLKFEFALWTRSMVKALIKRQCIFDLGWPSNAQI